MGWELPRSRTPGISLQDPRQTPDRLPGGHSLQHPFSQVVSGAVVHSAESWAFSRRAPQGLHILEAPRLEGSPGGTSLVLSFPNWRLACFWGTLPA